MPWTYDPSKLATNEIYAIRAEIQDTDPEDPQLDDNEIAYAITQERNFWSAAARCSEMIGRKILRKADIKLGRMMQITYTKMAQQWFDMARCLRAKAMGTVAPWVGGMSVSDKLAYMSDDDLVSPLFTKTMQENPWVGGYSTDSGPPVSESDSSTGED